MVNYCYLFKPRESKFKVTHFTFLENWPEHTMPNNRQIFSDLVNSVLVENERLGDHSIMVHS